MVQKLVPQNLTYQYFQEFRYNISQFQNLQSLCNNGFIKLYTIPTRAYWHAQNQFEHRVPDWKIHISVKHEELRKAWNLVVEVFLKLKCRSGMKTIYLKQSQGSQFGREITIYVVKYSKQFEKSNYNSQFGLGFAEEHSEEFWMQFIQRIEETLQQNKIQSNGLAPGDLPLGNYVSLRNQAFVLDDQLENYIYPPNKVGWNPYNHCIPFNIENVCKRLNRFQQKKSINKTIFIIPLLIFCFATGFYFRTKMINLNWKE